MAVARYHDSPLRVVAKPKAIVASMGILI
ncbi:hypothetical protein CCACVL1_07132 [Corchorus capsularis]|uniref:Uncharacterized protein n=1 Tax=Corchorus capsularis TaxID=210143 RepID=A0A1R3J963_COCAP|nr:hypothetical protein CCACVL1_07132 [Corchorus capsularis]